jgi:hypothetical protein
LAFTETPVAFTGAPGGAPGALVAAGGGADFNGT